MFKKMYRTKFEIKPLPVFSEWVCGINAWTIGQLEANTALYDHPAVR